MNFKQQDTIFGFNQNKAATYTISFQRKSEDP